MEFMPEGGGSMKRLTNPDVFFPVAAVVVAIWFEWLILTY